MVGFHLLSSGRRSFHRASLRRHGAAFSALVLGCVITLTAGCQRGQPADSTAPQPAKVSVVSAWTQPMDVLVSSVGTLKPVDQVLIAPEVAGLVKGLRFEEGTSVQAGDLLIELDDAIAQVDLTRAQAAQDRARQRLQRLQSAYEASAATPEDVDAARLELVSAEAEADRARIVLSKYRIYAPFAGRIGIKLVSPGAFVSPGDALASLTTTDPVEIEFNVPEVHLDAIRPGLTVNATTTALPNRSFQGEVVIISPTVDRATRTVQLLARVPNPPTASKPAGELKPGMFMNVSLVTTTRPNAIVVPEQSLFFQGPTTAVLAIEPDGKTVARRVVIVGERRPGLAEIVSGLDAGELVVVEGLQKARPGQTVQPVRDPQVERELRAAAARASSPGSADAPRPAAEDAGAERGG